MPLFEKARCGSDPASNIKAVAQQISEAVVERYREEETGRLNAETLLATTAALTGSIIRCSFRNMAEPEDRAEASEILREISFVLQTFLVGKGADKNDFVAFDEILSRTLGNKDYKTGLVLTNDPHHSPHENPAIGAAALREDALFSAHKAGLEEKDLAKACLYALAQTVGGVVSVLPAPVAYRMAMEVVVGAAYMEPLDRRSVPVVPKPVLSRRLVEAGSGLSEIFLKQSHAIADGARLDIPTMVAKAGAFLGEATHKAFVRKPIAADYVVSGEVNAFLEECNIQIMASYIRRGGDAKSLAEYGEYAANAAASIGQSPYPRHNVEEAYLPHNCPAAEAAMAREPAKEIAKKYNLLDWEMAAASLVAVNDHIRIAECFITTPVAARLAMEEAAAIARVAPVDWDSIAAASPRDVREGMWELQKKAAYAVSERYPHSARNILDQLFPR